MCKLGIMEDKGATLALQMAGTLGGLAGSAVVLVIQQ